jgi:hypothetical protein
VAFLDGLEQPMTIVLNESKRLVHPRREGQPRCEKYEEIKNEKKK